MESWILEEYNSLRLEKINDEHEKYFYSTLKNIIELLYFKNEVDLPDHDGWRVCVTSFKEVNGIMTGDFEYQTYDGGDYSEEFEFPAYWISLPFDQIKTEVVRKQIDNFNYKAKKQEALRSLAKQREISELEKKLSMLKGET